MRAAASMPGASPRARRARSKYTSKWRASAACRPGEQLARRTADARPKAANRSQERASMNAPQIIRSTSRCGSLLRDQRPQALGIAARRQPLRLDREPAMSFATCS